MLSPVLILGCALSCMTLNVVGITTRSVVQLSLPTHVFNLDEALGFEYMKLRRPVNPTNRSTCTLNNRKGWLCTLNYPISGFRLVDDLHTEAHLGFAEADDRRNRLERESGQLSPTGTKYALSGFPRPLTLGPQPKLPRHQAPKKSSTNHPLVVRRSAS